ncbi:MAG: NAD(P)-dependent oxidoreductase [Chitinophagaceae bacterium]|jgi:nucleoside-diphosphate-sugar epimerase|nr:NAD(P)-dependent oxidoreductase [Chitinophagaceae bacterium]
MTPIAFLTGASGFVGFHIINGLLQQGYKVVAAVRKSSDVRHLAGMDIQFVYPDFNNKESLAKELAAAHITHIVHVAGITKGRTQEDYNHANATITQNLALAAMQAGIDLQCFVFISSLAAMGPSLGKPLSESEVPHPVTFYGKSKLLAEKYLAEIPDFPFTILRPTAVYGPRDKDMFILIKSVKRGLEGFISHAKQQLSFLYVKDLANAVMLSLQHPATRKAYFVSDGGVYSQYDFSDTTKEILHKKTLRIYVGKTLVKGIAWFLGKSNPKKAPVINADKVKEITGNWDISIENIQKDLGFQPQYNLQEGLKESIDWYRENGWL